MAVSERLVVGRFGVLDVCDKRVMKSEASGCTRSGDKRVMKSEASGCTRSGGKQVEKRKVGSSEAATSEAVTTSNQLPGAKTRNHPHGHYVAEMTLTGSSWCLRETQHCNRAQPMWGVHRKVHPCRSGASKSWEKN